MAWRADYLDLTLSPLSFLFMLAYNVNLYFRFTRSPMTTVMGVNNRARRAWVRSIIQDNEKRNILAVQTLRNSIMGSTLLATTAILLSSAVAAFLASSYDVKQRLNSSVLGSQSPVSLAVKYMSLLAGFLSAFLCYVQSVRYTNHVNFIINLPSTQGAVTPEYVADVLERAANFHTIGTRAFYVTIPLLLWLFGPIPFFASTIMLIPIWYHLDSALDSKSGGEQKKTDEGLSKVSNANASEDDLRPLSRTISMIKHDCLLPICNLS